MRIIRPIIIGDTNLISSTVADNSDGYAYWDNTAYTVGTIVNSSTDHHLYECIIANTDKDPSTTPLDGSGDPYWLDLGANNRWRMFDDKTNNTTEATTSMTVVLKPNTIVNALSLFGLRGTTVRVYMTDLTDGIVFDTGTIPMNDNSGIGDWYLYFYEDFELLTRQIITGFPNYSNATITIVINAATGDTVKCGQVSLGKTKKIGDTLYGTSVSIVDYSRKEADSFGNSIVVERRYNDLVNYDITVNTNEVHSIVQMLANYRATPLTWIGEDNSPETIVYGYFRDFSIVLSNYTISDCSIEVEGLN